VEKPRVGLALGGAGVASFAVVGLLKRFQEEGIQIDYIVATGWPALFAVGYGFLRSVHDLEWFATRLQEKDFYAPGSLFEVSKDYASHERLSKLIENSFPQHDLAETRVPVLISTANSEPGESELYEKGDWKGPLLKTMSVPGIYRPYPENADANQGTSSLHGVDVESAAKRGARFIVAVTMYDDYFNSLKSQKGTSDAVFRRAYLSQIKSSIAKEEKLAHISGKITLGKSPGDFTAKRLAIQAGYKEAARIARELRTMNVN
jgi:predicted acylesterase/phospholipase RssA